MRQWRVFTQRRAKEDTNDIWCYIAQDNPKAGDAFLDALEEAPELLSTIPAIGGLRYFYHPELRGLRILPLQKFEKYLLFYRLREEENVIETVRIIHGARDIPSLFRQTAAGEALRSKKQLNSCFVLVSKKDKSRVREQESLFALPPSRWV
jgi:plasmid stabilization system protein ParE